jgi:hypothetical protein
MIGRFSTPRRGPLARLITVPRAVMNHLPARSSSPRLVWVTSLAVLSSVAATTVAIGTIAVWPNTPPDPRLILAVALFDLLVIFALAWSVRRLLRGLRSLRDDMAAALQEPPSPLPNPPTIEADIHCLRDAFEQMVGDVRRARREHQSAADVLAERARTVDRLLDFSQTIQGAGKPEQIFLSLVHFLRTDLGLAGIAIIAHDPETVPAMHVKAAWPTDLLRTESAITDVDAALCPCLRQNLPRQFNPGSPVRCAIDACLRLDTTHPAFCIPFTVGRSTRCVVHMLLSPGAQWTEPLRQLAQTYVNAAYSSLISLHLLAEAEKQSMTDALTGLYNRRSLEELLTREMALAGRHDHALSLVMIDLDNFKQVNDRHGHAAGDHLLRSFRRLRAHYSSQNRHGLPLWRRRVRHRPAADPADAGPERRAEAPAGVQRRRLFRRDHRA